MTTVRPLDATTGLCAYVNPDYWFTSNVPRITRQARDLCLQCPVIASCAQRAIDLEATHGMWASVTLPGARSPKALEEARDKLRDVIERNREQPAALRRRSVELRRSMYFEARERDRVARVTALAALDLPIGVTGQTSA